MGVTFLDGPADAVLRLRRAPMYLRVAISPDGQVDALDQLDDNAEPEETLHAYKLRGNAGRYHLLVRGENARSRGGWWASGEYEFCDPQPGDEVMRDNEKWRVWATEQARVSAEMD